MLGASGLPGCYFTPGFKFLHCRSVRLPVLVPSIAMPCLTSNTPYYLVHCLCASLFSVLTVRLMEVHIYTVCATAEPAVADGAMCEALSLSSCNFLSSFVLHSLTLTPSHSTLIPSFSRPPVCWNLNSHLYRWVAVIPISYPFPRLHII